MSEEIIEQPSQLDPSPPFYADPQVWLIGCGLLAIALIKLLQGGGFGGKQVLGRARWATRREISRAQKSTYHQILSKKLTDIGLWIGIPKGLEFFPNVRRISIPYDRRSIWLGELSQHLSLWASTGSGKSYSILNPLKRSAIIQGLSIIDFDAKGDEPTPPSCETAGYALKHGYRVYVIAPGAADSDRLNTWDFIAHETDADRATNKADALLANFNMAGGGGNNEFFTKAAGQMMSAIFLMIKGLPRRYQDMATAQKILSLPDLVKRIENANLPQYQKAAWGQFLSTAGSPETAASIASTASIILSRFFTPDILSVFHGDGNCPIDLSGRVMVIFRLNPEMESMKTLIAAGLQMMINRNVFTQRKNNLAVFLDEIPQLKIIGLEKILNVARSKGAFFLLGAQGLSNMEATYGKDQTADILNATKTQIVGQLTGEKAQVYFSKQLGDTQVQVKNKSQTIGKNRSRGKSDNAQTTPLMTTQELRGLAQGEFIFFSPQVGQKQKSRPFRANVRIGPEERRTIDEGLSAWHELRGSSPNRGLTEEELMEREQIALELLPLPDEQINQIMEEAL